MTDTIASVVQSVPPVASTTVSATVFDAFKASPELIAIAVVDGQHPVGLINRLELSAILATPYGRALYAGKPISLVMDPKPLIVRTDMHIDRLEEMILVDNPQALASGFILIHEDGAYAGIGSALSVLRSSVDRTIRRNQELELLRAEAEAANRAKSQFIAHMSHEIRTPMNAVIGLSRLALKRQVDSQLKDYLSKIYASANMLLGIINDILDFSKIEAGKLSLESVEFDLEMVIDGVASTTAIRASEKDIEFIIQMAPDVPTALVGDPLRLGQVLLNLVNNAIKFTDKGEVLVSVKVGVRNVQAIELEFSIQDTGIGISEDDQERLFRSFSQADASMSRRYGGTGLGLAISKALTELMRGTIKVASRPRAGSTFTVSAMFGLPPGNRPVLPMAPRLEGLRVLVVEDNEHARQQLGEILRRWSIEPDLVTSGQAGIAALQDAASRGVPFDLVLLDWHMPGMDGIETARCIKESRQIGRVPPMVLMIGFGQEESVRHARRFGIKGLLAKPINKSTLLETIQTVLGRISPKRSVKQGDALPDEALQLIGARILLVEDNDINCQIAVENLTAAGMLVEIAQNGRIAVEMLRAGADRFDAVLMDVQMPEMDGLEATRLVRQDIDSDSLPIIAMTAHALEDERQQCIAAGMDDHLSKPVDPIQLLRTLSRWVKNRVAVPASLSRPTSAPAPAVSLPRDLVCFDITAALVRTNNNERLLGRLLQDFQRDFSDVAHRLRELVELGEHDEAERLAHTVAGVSGALEAGALHIASRRVEYGLRDQTFEAIAETLDAFETALDDACREAASLDAPETSHEVDADAVSDQRASMETLESMVADLRRLLGENNLNASRRAAELEQALAGAGVDRQLTEMTDQMDRLDFRGAERTLDELAASIEAMENADADI